MILSAGCSNRIGNRTTRAKEIVSFTNNGILIFDTLLRNIPYKGQRECFIFARQNIKGRTLTRINKLRNGWYAFVTQRPIGCQCCTWPNICDFTFFDAVPIDIAGVALHQCAAGHDPANKWVQQRWYSIRDIRIITLDLSGGTITHNRNICTRLLNGPRHPEQNASDSRIP